MPVSVRMEPVLVKQLELEAKKRGMTKSQFIIDAVERMLGYKDPYKLLLQVQDEMKLELAAERRAVKRGQTVPVAAQRPSSGDKVRAVLRKKREQVRAAA